MMPFVANRPTAKPVPHNIRKTYAANRSRAATNFWAKTDGE